MKDDLFFSLFACCIIGKGHYRSVICDIDREEYRFLPSELIEIIELCRCKSIKDVKLHFENEYDNEIDDFLNDLANQELGFFCDDVSLYPPLNLEWDTPLKISNAIIDITNKHFTLDNLITQLNELGCSAIQIRSYEKIEIENTLKQLVCLNKSRISNVDLLLKYDANINFDFIERILLENKRISNIIFHSAPLNSTKIVLEIKSIVFQIQKIVDHQNCGIISDFHFSVNIPTFTESQLHNTCLNRKIGIDVDGNIKNCPSMTQSFGNIRDTTLQEALDHPDFKKYWNINKDKIHVCKDCEFRHICTDCRAYIENPEDIYSKPLKCGYNPYTAEWSEWSTNPLKEKAIKYYGMEHLVTPE
jgi:SPASM domain peptide maturase of grasp-with-spasm system